MLELVTDTRVDLSRSAARFGAGVFETIRIQDGQARWLPLHLERLAAGCAFLGLEEPPPEPVLLERIPLEGGVLRLLAVDRLLLAWTGPLDEAPATDLRIALSRETQRHPGPLTRHKTTSYLENILLMEEARRRNLEEVVAPTPEGRLSDGGRSTLVALVGGRLLTPPLEDGALPGIGRRVLLESGLVEARSISVGDFVQAPAVALVSALRGLRAAAEVEGAARDPFHPALDAAKAMLNQCPSIPRTVSSRASMGPL